MFGEIPELDSIVKHAEVWSGAGEARFETGADDLGANESSDKEL